MLLLTNSAIVSAEERNELCEQVVESGCQYVCCFGDDCEPWHDTLDECDVLRTLDSDHCDESSIMTSWHPDETIAVVVEFVIEQARWNNPRLENIAIVAVGDHPDFELAVRFARF